MADKVSGLTEDEARRRLAKNGPNEISKFKPDAWWRILLKILAEPMLILLLASGGLYLVIGELRDALMLVGGAWVVVGITVYQERKTEKTLAALRELASPRALVMRDGIMKRIPGSEVVMGDILMFQEGDRIPADAKIVEGLNLSVDESLLTGESMPVMKQPGKDDLTNVFSGTLVVSGRGLAEVTATGRETEMGKIGKSLATIKKEDTLLHKEMERVVRIFLILGLGLCLVVAILMIWNTGDWISGLLAGITLSMSMLPEEFPVILTIFLALGAWRISKRQVLTRRSDMIEMLGAATVLCVDKTGTLTENKMELTTIWAKGRIFEINEQLQTPFADPLRDVVEQAALASQSTPTDPMEKEIIRLEKLRVKMENTIENRQLIKEYPITQKVLALTHVWKSQDGIRVGIKGAAEAVMELCRMPEHERETLEKFIHNLSGQGLRVLGVAGSRWKKETLPDDPAEFKPEFLGLLGFIDPIRNTAPESIKEAYQAGIRIIMITGDYAGTAENVAVNVGIRQPIKMLTGAQLAKMTQEELRNELKTVNVCSRIVPEQKLLIVEALKANGEIVAMTGDGVNDAPALKAAHIGIAMGGRGTDVAREAAGLVLLNDDFSSIVAAIKLGRRIFDNIKRAVGYVLAVHIPIAGISLLPLILNQPEMLLPAHIAFLELIIDPACSTVFEAEPEADGIMARPPRSLKERILGRRELEIGLLQGSLALVAVVVIYEVAKYAGWSINQQRAMIFIVLVAANLFLILTNISWEKNWWQTLRDENRALRIVLAGATAALTAILFIPWLRETFHFGLLSIWQVLGAIGAAAGCIMWFEVIKKLVYIKPSYGSGKFN